MPPDVPRGTIELHGDYANLRFERVYPHAIEHVWEAISTPEGLREWLMCTHALIEGRVGGRFDTISGPPQYHSTGTILVWDPPHRLEYERSMPPVPEMPDGQHAIFRFHLSELNDATRMVVIYEHFTKDAARGFLPGVHVFLDRLQAQLAGAPLPDWHARFGELVTKYPAWSGHAHAGR